MRRILLTATPAAVVALVFGGVAWAGNGGFGPPPAHSPNAQRITSAYWVIFGFTAAVAVIVIGAIVVFVLKYRSRGRPREVDGIQLHGHTRLELIWTVIPVLILAAIAGFVFYKLPGIANVPVSKQNRLNVRLDAHQFYWQFTYPNGAISINTLHVPTGKVVYLDLHSEDVIHSFWVPELAGKTDVIPGRVNHAWFEADKNGTYQGRCAELCGLFHAKMSFTVVAESQQAYNAFVSRSQSPAELGKAEFQGVCQLCHGLAGRGGFGPALAGNPLVQQPAGIEQITRNGREGPRGVMPPVARGWSKEQMDALTSYLSQHLGGAASGG